VLETGVCEFLQVDQVSLMFRQIAGLGI